MASVGAALSTVNVVLGPAAAEVLPAVSEAVAAAREIPTVPLPEQADKVTVGVVVVPFVTPIVQLASPVELSETSPAARLTESEFE